ncbi:MAG TPA: Fe-S oxidoreductase [Crocinitomicaceae bacterium]|nr:(Fe-S)-binding protein [Flavobacteriales bacterium]HBW85706.1 Fe-S oxidoreductase [Crocinitomicaceae bacterium]
MIEIVVFSVLLVFGFGWFTMNILKVRQNILLGRDVKRSDKTSERWSTMLLVAFGQKKMFSRPIPALLHLTLYVAFVITQVELVEIIADGITGNHRMFMDSLSDFYVFMISFIELLSVLAFVGTIAFLARRNMLKLPRLTMDELKGWPMKDANLILIMEIVLILCIFTMNGADDAMQQESYGFLISSFLGANIFKGMNHDTLHLLENIGWWGHFIMVLTFMNYLPYSKHFHIFLAFPNTYYSNLDKKGKLTNMESVTAEVKLMLDPNADPYSASTSEVAPSRFGAKDVTDLTWKNLLDAYTCTECGRCTSSCPANITGKKLSPRKIMMDTRDRLVEIGELKRKHGKDYEDGKSLLGDFISEEEIWACTSCNACVQECPVNIDPLSIIVDLRRYLVMEESKMPMELTGMLTNIENNGAPWQFSPSDRLNWANED